MSGFLQKNKGLIFLLIIIAIAAFFRLWQIDSIPPGLYPDEAIYANDALDSLKTGNFRVFYPENNGREGLFIWLLAFSFSTFGISIWSLKIVPATIGILTILGLYLLTKELFINQGENTSRYIAFLSSFFLAISFWHVNFSRIGFRAILLPFILVFAFYFLFKALNQLKNKSKQLYSSVAFSGIIFGLGFYSYSSFRMVVLILAFIFIPLLFFYKKQNLFKKFLLFTFYFLFFIFIVALPIGLYFLQNPEYFIGRMAPISIFAAENPIKEFGKSLILHLGMFNFYGDSNWRHNFAGSPQLFWPIGILFLIGFVLSLKELIKFPKHKNLSLVTSHWLLVIWLFVMLLPGILTYEGIPHALRTIGVIPPVYIFAGLASWNLYNFFDQNTRNKKLLILTSIIFLLMVMVVQFDKYFLKWAKRPEVKDAFSKNYVEIGNYLNSLSPEIQKYVVVNVSGVPVPYPHGLPMSAQTVMFIERTKYGKTQSIYLLPKDLEEIKIEKETIIVPLAATENIFKELLGKFPQGLIRKINEIWIYEIY